MSVSDLAFRLIDVATWVATSDNRVLITGIRWWQISGCGRQIVVTRKLW